jgi:hypothetical protein
MLEMLVSDIEACNRAHIDERVVGDPGVYRKLQEWVPVVLVTTLCKVVPERAMSISRRRYVKENDFSKSEIGLSR